MLFRSYTSITTSTTASNVYTFNGVNLTYYSTNTNIITNPSTQISNFNYVTMNLFFLPASTENTLPLYAYNPAILDSITITDDSDLKETYRASNNPVLTFLPHNDRDSSVVAIFDINGNHRFVGIDQKDSITYLDEYAWQIVRSEEHTSELQSH